ncbi:hypothetical protein EYZ11_012584 [Aspergillus tanneri]|uniref:Alpha/beta hydrolase fold-3 domain-containing protein n=1 Tax=Aspergillus tanneri TaxID=1220188 RepID=A0A4S3IZW2_9EURO|nr:uncharacterized protein ATNIH1004_010163 [Aspergillus tanneri]KAA8643394.1 hypothetical protein ATNIH1004_010163 [Aspergillus tanneri]THC87970.1 hypothetical protein EYZ11_012584 [Aspergillus tanneri]
MKVCDFPAPDDSVTTEEITLETAWIRIYTPPSATGDEPVAVFIHGGGWVMDSVDVEDPHWILPFTSAQVPHGSRRLPASMKCTLEHFSPSSVVLVGGSAGTNFTFGLALKLIDAGLKDKVKGILALVPATVHPNAMPEYKKTRYTEMQENADRTINSSAAMNSWLEAYDPPLNDVYFSSSILYPRLGDVKKVYIVECGADTLRDDARLMEALEDVKVPLMYNAYPGYPHYLWAYPASVLGKHREEFHTNMFGALLWLHE